MTTIGLDVSTSIVGIAVLRNDGSLVELRHCDLRRVVGTVAKACAVREEADRLWRIHGSDVDRVAVELNLQRFAMGKSSALTITQLARFNGIVSFIFGDRFQLEPCFVSFARARNVLGIKLKRGTDAKQAVWEHVSSVVDRQWDVKTLRQGKRQGQSVLQPWCYDEADAYVVAAAVIKDPAVIVG